MRACAGVKRRYWLFTATVWVHRCLAHRRRCARDFTCKDPVQRLHGHAVCVSALPCAGGPCISCSRRATGPAASAIVRLRASVVTLFCVLCARVVWVRWHARGRVGPQVGPSPWAVAVQCARVCARNCICIRPVECARMARRTHNVGFAPLLRLALVSCAGFCPALTSRRAPCCKSRSISHMLRRARQHYSQGCLVGQCSPCVAHTVRRLAKPTTHL